MSDDRRGVEVDFADRYGPWALIAGASDGVGEEFACAIAERGLNVVLLARRQAMLDKVAASVRDRFGVETRTLAIDLAQPDAIGRAIDGTTDLTIGMIIYCAGADPNYEPFLTQPVDAHLTMIQRNCVMPLLICHHFATSMRERGRGGIVLVSSAAALMGGENVVTYSATKAFDMVLADGLWAELHTHGIDVLSLVLGLTDTPALRALLAKRKNLAGPDDPTEIPGAATPAAVVAEAIAHLANGPTCFAGEELRQAAMAMGSMPRNELARLRHQGGGGVMDTKLNPDA